MGELFAIVAAEPFLPDGLASLARDAEEEGIRIVATVLERWRDGTERYRGAGEVLLAATSHDAVVGVGGISKCPTIPSALRVRRFYVAPAWRGRGVARALATRVVGIGFEHTDVITCNARASAAAAPFWERMGFVPVDAEGITHMRRR